MRKDRSEIFQFGYFDPKKPGVAEIEYVILKGGKSSVPRTETMDRKEFLAVLFAEQSRNSSKIT